MAELCRLVEAGEKYRVLYVDPPWPYRNRRTRGAAARHYRTMPLDEIAALPVRELAAPDAQLWLWTTNGFLFEAHTLLEGWGFTFNHIFSWCKPQMGLGNCWRVCHEFLLWAVRGNCSPCRPGLPMPDHFVFPRRRHSEKPAQVRAWIEDACSGPYLELFARQAPPGWTVWGDEAPLGR